MDKNNKITENIAPEIKEIFSVNKEAQAKVFASGILGPVLGNAIVNQGSYSKDKISNLFENIKNNQSQKKEQRLQEKEQKQQSKQQSKNIKQKNKNTGFVDDDFFNINKDEDIVFLDFDSLNNNSNDNDVIIKSKSNPRQNVKIDYENGKPKNKEDQIQGVVHGNEFVLNAKQVKKLSEENPTLLQQLSDLNKKMDLKENPKNNLNVNAYVTGGLVQTNTDKEINKDKGKEVLVSKMYDKDFQLVSEISKSTDISNMKSSEDIYQQQETKKQGLTSFILDTNRNNHLEQIRKNTQRLVYLSEIGSGGSGGENNESSKYGIMSTIKQKFAELKLNHPVLTSFMGILKKGTMRPEFLIPFQASAFAGFGVLNSLAVGLAGTLAKPVIKYIFGRRIPYSDELKLKGKSIEEQQLETQINIFSRTQQIYDKLGVLYKAFGIDDEDSDYRTARRSRFDEKRHNKKSKMNNSDLNLYLSDKYGYFNKKSEKQFYKNKNNIRNFMNEYNEQNEDSQITYRKQKKLYKKSVNNQYKRKNRVEMSIDKTNIQLEDPKYLFSLNPLTNIKKNKLNKRKKSLLYKKFNNDLSYLIKSSDLSDDDKLEIKYLDSMYDAGYVDDSDYEQMLFSIVNYNPIKDIKRKHKKYIKKLFSDTYTPTMASNVLSSQLKNKKYDERTVNNLSKYFEKQKNETFENKFNQINEFSEYELLHYDDDKKMIKELSILSSEASSQTLLQHKIYDLLVDRTKNPESQFKDGGYTGSGFKNEKAGIVHKDEYVLTSDTLNNKNIFVKLLDSIQNNNIIDTGKNKLYDILSDIRYAISPKNETLKDVLLYTDEKNREENQLYIKKEEEENKTQNLISELRKPGIKDEETTDNSFITTLKSIGSSILDIGKFLAPFAGGAAIGWLTSSLMKQFGVEGSDTIIPALQTSVAGTLFLKFGLGTVGKTIGGILGKTAGPVGKVVLSAASQALTSPLGWIALGGIQAQAGTVAVVKQVKAENSRLSSTIGDEYKLSQTDESMKFIEQFSEYNKMNDEDKLSFTENNPLFAELLNKSFGKNLSKFSNDYSSEFDEIQKVVKLLSENKDYIDQSEEEKMTMLNNNLDTKFTELVNNVQGSKQNFTKSFSSFKTNMNTDTNQAINSVYTQGNIIGTISDTLKINDFSQFLKGQSKDSVYLKLLNKEYETEANDVYKDIKSKYDKYWKKSDIEIQVDDFIWPTILMVRTWDPQQYYSDEINENKDVEKDELAIKYLNSLKQSLLNLLLQDKDFKNAITKYSISKNSSIENEIESWADSVNSVNYIDDKEKFKTLLNVTGFDGTDSQNILETFELNGVDNYNQLFEYFSKNQKSMENIQKLKDDYNEKVKDLRNEFLSEQKDRRSEYRAKYGYGTEKYNNQLLNDEAENLQPKIDKLYNDTFIKPLYDEYKIASQTLEKANSNDGKVIIENIKNEIITKYNDILNTSSNFINELTNSEIGQKLSDSSLQMQNSWQKIKDGYIIPNLNNQVSSIYNMYNGRPEYIKQQQNDILKFQQDNNLNIDPSTIPQILIQGKDQFKEKSNIIWKDITKNLNNFNENVSKFFNPSNVIAKKIDSQSNNSITSTTASINDSPYKNISNIFDMYAEKLDTQDNKNVYKLSSSHAEGIKDAITQTMVNYSSDTLQKLSQGEKTSLLDRLKNWKQIINDNKQSFPKQQTLLSEIENKEMEIKSLKDTNNDNLNKLENNEVNSYVKSQEINQNNYKKLDSYNKESAGHIKTVGDEITKLNGNMTNAISSLNNAINNNSSTITTINNQMNNDSFKKDPWYINGLMAGQVGM